ncbi:hypothetical protein SAMN04487905_109190 [Actinopolyspora xinjiangensis]|uniref:Excreted virulence factor EspC, type VII ESX diderm n=1 Tax=Actinopolyspora xinjiangensis TaxID=405564 RepID=A0A1H0VSH7_9ACTN|nr:hypothetical protein [Actinopolyspora xinjiangensis]SDP81201.1 hypothetical protein SAMN04487905_109190 [Actinopolyspora xinjiangensis]
MGDGYRVDIEKLTRLISDLDNAADDITAANRALGDARGRDLGTSGIDDASDGFRERWSHGIEKIAEGAKATSEALGSARETYAKLEQEVVSLVTSAVTRQQSSSGGSGGQDSQGEMSAIEQRMAGQ